MNLLLNILLAFTSFVPNDTILGNIDTIAVIATMKSANTLEKQAISFSQINLQQINNKQIESIKDIAASVPNFYQPRYGSRITSSIYIRGLGSRIDQPALCVNVDDIPIMNKNAMDFDFFDVQKIEILRGPQGTLYGRNSNGGVLNISTLSPFNWQGVRAQFSFDSELSYKTKVSIYQRPSSKFGYSISTLLGKNQGFFTNSYTEKPCDFGTTAAIRSKMRYAIGNATVLENILSFSRVDEGGYAYHQYDENTKKHLSINYNDTCSYTRTAFSEGFIVKHYGKKIKYSSITSYQFLDDELLLDNDFTTLSYFIMNQKQKEHTITQEFIVANKDKNAKWQWSSGFFGFNKHLTMSAPVTFKKDGIDRLILNNANKGIHTMFPENNILIEEESFPIYSDFSINTTGAALFHESNYKIRKWNFTTGVRIDFEYAKLVYDSHSQFNYLFDLTMNSYKKLSSNFIGEEQQHSFVVLPKLSAQYEIENHGIVYGTISAGHKAGGFNTQIFSDIMQSIIMNDLLSSMGMSFEDVSNYTTASSVEYKPETNINFELGSHVSFSNFKNNIALFVMEGFNQQITVLPQGTGVGRMMSNAGRTRSFGIEYSGNYEISNWIIGVDYGYTNAKFVKYQYNDTINYTGKHIPYSPQNTISASISYKFNIQKKLLQNIVPSIQYKGIGKIYWNDENSLSQSLYSLVSASITVTMKHCDLKIFCQNITNTKYHTFYFRSISQSFFSDGTPRLYGILLNFQI